MFFFVLGFQQFVYSVPLFGVFHVASAWEFMSFLDLWVYGFHQVWKILGYKFFKDFPVPSIILILEESHYIHI